MKITVTNKHITTACQRNSHHCMIADAIADGIDGAKFILVDLQSIRWTDLEEGVRYTYLTPPRAQDAIILFDRGKKCQPFTFNLNSPRTRKMGSGGTEPKGARDKRRNPIPGANLRKSRVAYKDREYGIRRFKK